MPAQRMMGRNAMKAGVRDELIKLAKGLVDGTGRE